MIKPVRAWASGIAGCSLLAGTLLAQPTEVPKPAEVFGFEPGADYKLARYDQLLDYYRQLAATSDRVELETIGSSVLGRPLLLLTLSSRENLSQIDRWQSISSELAHARIDEPRAHELAREGKVVVWIDAGLHATERAPAQMMPLLAYHLATDESAETTWIRDNVVTLLMPEINPDGLEIVADWYEQVLGTPYETTNPPWLYHAYAGHDNNRDWFMNNLPETAAANRILYQEWTPQIVYNHHQTGPAWARIFVPPFADPVNPNIHPGVTTGVNLVGAAISSRFALEGMPGAVSDMTYSMWWNGGLRTVPYFHNMIGILTEASHSTPSPRYYDPKALPPSLGNGRRGHSPPTSGTDIFYPYPWQGGASHFRDAVDYTLTASLAVLEVAADRRQRWLFDHYRMGRDAIQKAESPRQAYVFPTQQWDPGEAVALLNILLAGGVEVHRATSSFAAGEQQFDAGTFIVFEAQAFRPYIVDLLEAQQYPDRRSPDGEPDPPYDLTGWTLPLQMGITVERAAIPEELDIEPASLPVRLEAPPPERSRFGYALSPRWNSSAQAVNELLAEGFTVERAVTSFDDAGQEMPAGTFLVDSGRGVSKKLGTLSEELGIRFVPLTTEPEVVRHALARPRVALYRSWVPSMDEGWTRWVLQRYGFAVDRLDNDDARSVDLSHFDAIVIPDQAPEEILNGHLEGTMPNEFVGGLGLEGTLELRNFVAAGGTLVALDRAANFAIEQFGLPVRNVLAGVSSQRFFIPGSLIRAEVEGNHPLAWGLEPEVAAFFVRSQAFEPAAVSQIGEGGQEQTREPPPLDVETFVRYGKQDLLLSGWELGAQEHLTGKAAALRVRVGSGEVVLIGFRCQFRGQPRSTFKLLFNTLFASTVEPGPWDWPMDGPTTELVVQ